MQPVLSMESLLLKSTNGEKPVVELEQLTASVFKDDLCIEKLERELAVLVDVVHVELPDVKKITSIRTICEAMRTHANRQMFSEVHKLLRLFLTIQITSSTSEQSFSALRRLLAYLRSTMTEKRLNNCFMLHVHKDITDQINLRDVAKEFIAVNDDRSSYFGSFTS